mgnify:FL=1
MYDAVNLPLRLNLLEAHEAAWRTIAAPGAFWSGAERLAIIAESRNALTCAVCAERKEALSPRAVAGEHDKLGALPPTAVEAIHHIRTDPGRLTRCWFDEVIAAGLSVEAYVELVGVMNTAVILDSFSLAIGAGLTPLPEARNGQPSGEANDAVVDVGAWMPVQAADTDDGVGGLPKIPMIARAMGRVPQAMALFFSVVRQHYKLTDFPHDLSRPQIELSAARVSAINQCFY